MFSSISLVFLERLLRFCIRGDRYTGTLYTAGFCWVDRMTGWVGLWKPNHAHVWIKIKSVYESKSRTAARWAIRGLEPAHLPLKRPVSPSRISIDVMLSYVPFALCVLLSVQCISSIGQIIKSVCVSVSQWVSESVTQNELNALQIAIFHRSSPNLAPR